MERTRMTNCLRIHIMDTEELAKFLLNEFVDHCCDSCPAYSKICSNNTNNPLKFNRPTNCKNCGAPLVSCKCEYCGTMY